MDSFEEWYWTIADLLALKNKTFKKWLNQQAMHVMLPLGMSRCHYFRENIIQLVIIEGHHRYGVVAERLGS